MINRILKKLFPFIILLLTGAAVFTQAQEPLNIDKFLPESCLIAGKFNQQQRLADIPKPLDSSGQYIFNCSQGLIWATEQPQSETLVYRLDDKHYIQTPGEKAKRLRGRINREMGKILNNLIGANREYLRDNFEQTLLNENQLKLVPKNKHVRNHIASITVTPGIVDGKNTIQIDIDQVQEFLAITIFPIQTFAQLDQPICSEKFPAYSSSCALLFD